MSDQRFFDLAMKAVAHQATDTERAELDALLARQPELRAEFARLQADTRLAREVLPLLNVTEATAPELPAWARGQLQTKVRETFGRRPAPERAAERDALGRLWNWLPEIAPSGPAGAAEGAAPGMFWKWRWVLGLAAATAVMALLVLPVVTRSAPPLIQVAMLDTAGATRGSDTNAWSLLRQSWEKATIDSFTDPQALHTWETNWPAPNKSPVVKVVFDPATGEVRLLGRWKGDSFAKTLLVEQNLATTLEQARSFIKDRTSR
jgi:hypothetical protein